ncbi:MAG: hypothetical protein VKI81_08655, partial [Synechococcaceae cyanobacterium]|nr:hypothetical protein [Synechococcaceae cyanobacterium]
VHTRVTLGVGATLALLGGLLLLGLALAQRRRADHGLLWGAVGLHGGLVGLWFLLAGGLLELSPAAPAWLVGPGGASPNPIGGVAGWLGLGLLLAFSPSRAHPPAPAPPCCWAPHRRGGDRSPPPGAGHGRRP